ncbi:MAG: hypothetical protein GEV03_22740 [Streptosporangiales bacterium]|nr:hypothetical protein [Streptosporangiales bacterium]
MLDVLATTITVAALVLAGWSLLTTLLNRRVGISHLAGLAGLEVLLLVQAGVGIFRLVGGQGPDEPVLFLAYLIGALFIPPAAALWGITDRSRWGSGVVAVAGLVTPVLIVRLQQIWQTVHG